MIKIFKRFLGLLDVKDTDFINKDGYIPKVNESLGKLELLPEKGQVNNTSTKTANYTMTLDNQYVLVDSTSGNITITLPTAVGNNGKRYTIKKIVLVNTVTIDADGTETIDGSLTKDITTQYESVTVVSDGSNWFII